LTEIDSDQSEYGASKPVVAKRQDQSSFSIAISLPLAQIAAEASALTEADTPTVSAISAPRDPIGFGAPRRIPLGLVLDLGAEFAPMERG
jgi:hypothetical protein